MILVFGDSHVEHLKRRLKDLPHGQDYKFNSVVGLNWGAFELSQTPEGLHVFADRLPGYGRLDLTISGARKYFFSSPLHSAPICRDAVWKSYCPWACAIGHPDITPISNATIETWLEADLAPRFALLKIMKQRGYDITVVEPPKPLHRAPLGHGIKPDIMRAVDEMQRGYVTGMLAKLDIPVLTVPEYTVSDGFTTDAFSNENPKDKHHGSLCFYKAMMEKIIKASV